MEIIRIVIGLISMACGCWCLWYAKHISEKTTIAKMNWADEDLYVDCEADIATFNMAYSRLIYPMALACFLDGVVFVYIPSMFISVGIVIVLLIVAFLIMTIGYHRLYKKYKDHGE